jgi:hypothetical protein
VASYRAYHHLRHGLAANQHVVPELDAGAAWLQFVEAHPSIGTFARTQTFLGPRDSLGVGDQQRQGPSH